MLGKSYNHTVFSVLPLLRYYSQLSLLIKETINKSPQFFRCPKYERKLVVVALLPLLHPLAAEGGKFMFSAWPL